MDFDKRHVIVTGGAGALGQAVVGALLAAGAVCRVPVRDGKPPEGWLADDRIEVVTRCDLSNEADVERLYGGADDLWASIHLAGGFDMAPVAETDKAALTRLLDMNLVSCHLCCRAAARRFGAGGGRIVNVAARTALEPRTGAGMLATLTMRPPPAPKRFAAARQHRWQLTRFMSSNRVSAALSVSATGAMSKPPARWIDAHKPPAPTYRRSTSPSLLRSQRVTTSMRSSASHPRAACHRAPGLGIPRRLPARPQPRPDRAPLGHGHDDMWLVEVHVRLRWFQGASETRRCRRCNERPATLGAGNGHAQVQFAQPTEEPSSKPRSTRSRRCGCRHSKSQLASRSACSPLATHPIFGAGASTRSPTHTQAASGWTCASAAPSFSFRINLVTRVLITGLGWSLETHQGLERGLHHHRQPAAIDHDVDLGLTCGIGRGRWFVPSGTDRAKASAKVRHARLSVHWGHGSVSGAAPDVQPARVYAVSNPASVFCEQASLRKRGEMPRPSACCVANWLSACTAIQGRCGHIDHRTQLDHRAQQRQFGAGTTS